MLPTHFPKEKEKSSSNHIHVLLRTRRTKQMGTGRDSSVFRGDGKLRKSWAPTVGGFNTHCREQPGAGARDACVYVYGAAGSDGPVMLTSAAEAVEGAEQWRERHYLIRSWSPGSNEGDLSSRRAAGSLSAWRNAEAAEERAPTLPTETQPRVTLGGTRPCRLQSPREPLVPVSTKTASSARI